MGTLNDIAGQRFGRLQVLHRSGSTPRGAAVWRVRCDCGTEKDCRTDTLTNGITVSCGCYRSECSSTRSRTHGMTNTFEFSAWKSMRQRCNYVKHPKYHLYGGRGIEVCRRWEKFENFVIDMGLCPFEKGSIERLNGDKNYTPSNCVWLLKAHQSKTRRNVHKIDGLTIPDLAAKHGLGESTLRHRLAAGWERDRLFIQPKH